MLVPLPSMQYEYLLVGQLWSQFRFLLAITDISISSHHKRITNFQQIWCRASQGNTGAITKKRLQTQLWVTQQSLKTDKPGKGGGGGVFSYNSDREVRRPFWFEICNLRTIFGLVILWRLLRVKAFGEEFFWGWQKA